MNELLEKLDTENMPYKIERGFDGKFIVTIIRDFGRISNISCKKDTMEEALKAAYRKLESWPHA